MVHPDLNDAVEAATGSDEGLGDIFFAHLVADNVHPYVTTV